MKKRQAKKSAKKVEAKKTEKASKKSKPDSKKTEKASKKKAEKKPKKAEKAEVAPKGKAGKKSGKGAPAVVTTSKITGLKLPELLASKSFLDISAGFDKIEDQLESHAVYLKASAYVKNALSTGILHYDLMMGGGLAPGKMTVEYGPEGSGKCVTGDTLIQTEHGIIPIKSLFKKNDPWDKFVRRNILINTATGPKRTSHIFRRKASDLRELKGDFSLGLKCTSEHPVLTVDKVTGELKYVESKKMKRGDIMFVKRTGLHATSDKPSLVGVYDGEPLEMSLDLATILGIVIADGYVDNYDIKVGKRQNLAVLDNLARCLDSVFGEDSYSRVSYKRLDSNGKKYTYHRVDILAKTAKVLRSNKLVGRASAREKRIPECIFKASREVIEAFLKAYFSCDYSARGIASIDVAHDLASLLLSIGIPSNSSYESVTTAEGKHKYHSLSFGVFSHKFSALAHFPGMVDKYRRKISSDRCVKFPKRSMINNLNSDPFCWLSYPWAYDIVSEFKRPMLGANSGFYKVGGKNVRLKLGFDKNVTATQLEKYPEHIASLELVLPKLAETLKFIRDNDLIAVRLLSNRKLAGEHAVYDVTVPDGHNFIANGFVIHNSTRFFTAVTSALLSNTLPVVEDAESSLNAGYVDRIIRSRTGYTLDDLVGEQDAAGNWVKPPFMRYYNETIAQKVFRRMKRSLDLFPDVVESRAGEFFKITRAKDGSIISRVEYDGAPQAAYFVDSAAALIPESVDDNDESNAMAAMARVFAWGFPLIKGRVAAKHVCLFFTNQVRNKPGQLMGCVHSDTVVPFADGRHFTMEEVVKNKIGGYVWSHNEKTNIIEKRKIIGWHNNGEVNEAADWVSVQTGTVNTMNGTCGFTVTRDHEVDTARGWVKACELVESDKIATRNTEVINGKLREFLVGTFVGDCALVAYNNGNAGAINLTNNEQPEYLSWKLNKLGRAFNFTAYTLANGVTYRSDLSHELSQWKTKLGRRSMKNMFEFFTPLSLAVLYMDDGHRDERASGASRACISVKRFAKNQVELGYFEAAFSKLGLSTTVSDGRFYFDQTNALKLFKLVSKFVPPCMAYKLPEEFRGQYRDMALTFKKLHSVTYVPIKRIRIGSSRQMRKRTKYDITVEGNHNYMVGNTVNGVIVHNSPLYMPGGDTFKHNNDARNFTEARHPKSKEMSMDAKTGENFTREKSITGGEDRYHYQRIRNEKNKQYTPRRTALMRTRLEHNGKPGDGVCETFDAFQYLRSTGQVTKRGETLSFSVEPTKQGGKIPDLLGMNGGKCDWLTFKKLVELPENKKIVQKHCRAQLISGYAFQLETQAQSKGVVIEDGD